ncbi:MAG TPA: hypothetical protein VJV78_48905 [Polyangiales bacterium]|nr:hypothetical protein [Polyangiales bacterium]
MQIATYGGRVHPLRRASAFGLVALHLVIDPLALPAVSLANMFSSEQLDVLVDSIPAAQDPTDHVVFIAEMPHAAELAYVASMQAVRGQTPSKLYPLFGGAWAARFERRGERGLRVTSELGFFSPQWQDRSPELPFQPGDEIELGELSARVLEVTADGRPRSVDFTFHESLESERYVWLTWREDRLVPFHPPGNRERTVVAAR